MSFDSDGTIYSLDFHWRLRKSRGRGVRRHQHHFVYIWYVKLYPVVVLHIASNVFGFFLLIIGKDCIFLLTGVANTLGRFFAGLIANIGRFSHLTICNVGLLLSAVACFLFFLCTTFSTLLGFAITYGFFIGSFIRIKYAYYV